MGKIGLISLTTCKNILTLQNASRRTCYVSKMGIYMGRNMQRSIFLMVVLMVVAGCLMVGGCGQSKDISGIYTTGGMTLTLTTDGAATLELPPIPSMSGMENGMTQTGKFSFDGNILKVVVQGHLENYGNEMTKTFKIAGDDLIETTKGFQGVWKKV